MNTYYHLPCLKRLVSSNFKAVHNKLLTGVRFYITILAKLFIRRWPMLGRRDLVLLGLASAVPLASANAQSPITLVNIGAWDCPICVAWTNNQKPGWLASEEIKRVNYVPVEAPRIRLAYNDEYWAGSLKAIRDLIPNQDRHGTPRWLIVKDGVLLSNRRDWSATLDDLRKII